MEISCEHNSKLRKQGLCAKCADIKPYMVFRFGPKGGYFWGPGYPIEAERGQRPYWSSDPNESPKAADAGSETVKDED